MDAWNNPEAGMHPLPDDPREVAASIRAGERCMGQFPYLGIRFGARGEAFARTDSGYLATLADGGQAYVTAQVKWLARVLSNRGMPRWLMEVHLDLLAEELCAAVPESSQRYGMLREAAQALRTEREGVIPPADFLRLGTQFHEESGGDIDNFGGLVVSAVCDEALGVEGAVSSMLDWSQEPDRLSARWREAVAALVVRARLLAGPGGTGGPGS